MSQPRRPSPVRMPAIRCAILSTSVVADRLDRDDHRDRHAPLPRRAEAGVDRGVGGQVEVGVGQHDHVVLRAAERLHPLAVGRARRRRRSCATGVEPTNETPRTSGWSSSASTASASPCTTLKTPSGSPASANHCASSVEAVGSFSDGLSTTALPQAIAIGTNHIGTMAGKLNGEITATTPSGCRRRVRVDRGRHVLAEAAAHQGRDAAGVLDDLEPALHLARRVVEHLAVLGGDRGGQLVAAGVRRSPGTRTARRYAGTATRRATTRAAAAAAAHGDVDVGRRGEAPRRPRPHRSPGRTPRHGARRRRSQDFPSTKWFTRRVTAASTARIASTRMPSALAGLVLGQGHRRAHPDHVAVQAALADQQAAGLALLEHPHRSRPRRARWCPAGRTRREHQALAADLRHDRAARGRLAQPVAQDRADAGRVALQVVVEHVVEHRVAGRRRDRVAAEGGERDRRHRVHDLGAADHAGQREAVADALGEGQQVRHDAVGLVAPEVLAGAAPAGLHLVGDQQDPVLVEHLLERAEGARPAACTNPPTPWIGSAISAATSPAVCVASTSRRSSTAASTCSSSASPASRPRSRSPECSQLHLQRVERGRRPAAVAGDRPWRRTTGRGSCCAPRGSGWSAGRFVATSSAASLASVPELVKNTRASGMPETPGDLLGELDLLADQVERRGVHDAGARAGARPPRGSPGCRSRSCWSARRRRSRGRCARAASVTRRPEPQTISIGSCVVDRHPGRHHGLVAGQQVIGHGHHAFIGRHQGQLPPCSTPRRPV